MAQFNRTTVMRITNEDRVALIYGQAVLEQIAEQMENENIDYIENLETSELVEYGDIRTALDAINSLLDEKTGRSWKLI